MRGKPGRRHNPGTYRSGLEDTLAQQIAGRGFPVEYETLVIPYEKPVTKHRYKPDFRLPNGLIIESKGIFSAEDRKKHLLIKAQHPGLDIRFVFSRSTQKINKGSKTSYADWCVKNGFLYADKRIPEEWFEEPAKEITLCNPPETSHGRTSTPSRSTPERSGPKPVVKAEKAKGL